MKESNVRIFIIPGIGEIMGTWLGDGETLSNPRVLRLVQVDKGKPLPPSAVSVGMDKAIISAPIIGKPAFMRLPQGLVNWPCDDEKLLAAYRYEVTGLMLAQDVQIQEVEKSKRA